MHLLVEGLPVAEPVSEEQAKDMLEKLRDGSSAKAVLYKDKDSSEFFIMAAASEGGFALDYQEGMAAQYYKSTDRSIPFDQVLETFLKYLNEDMSWMHPFEWELVDPKKVRGGSGCMGLAVLFAGAAALASALIF